MPSYLEIALRATMSTETQNEQRGPEPPRILRGSDSVERSRESSTPTCGSSDCGGCYEVEQGVRIHQPKCGESYRAWFERWEAKGKVQ